MNEAAEVTTIDLNDESAKNNANAKVTEAREGGVQKDKTYPIRCSALVSRLELCIQRVSVLTSWVNLPVRKKNSTHHTILQYTVKIQNGV